MREQTADLLKKARMRVTAQRVAVLEAIEREGSHLEADAIVRSARGSLPGLSRQAVFDNLNALVAAGIVRRIEPAGRPALYEARVGDNHHHLICRRCMATVDVDCRHGSAPCLEPADKHDFVIDEAEVVFWGLCPKCQTQERNEETNNVR